MSQEHDDELVMSLVDRAMSQPPDAREAWLSNACAGDMELFRKAWEYVQWDDCMRDFLLEPMQPVAGGGRAAETLAAGDQLGSYEILGPIGMGGMGEVYRAKDTKLGRQVAIKVLPSHLTADTTARQRLLREASAAAAVDHPFICKVFEIGEAREVLFLAMEFIDGETLEQRLSSRALPLPEALRFAGEVAEALEKAHTHRIVHRDLKPANIMVAQGHAKVMDFGLAKPFEAVHPSGEPAAITGAGRSFTEPGTLIGTPDYMSPEQLRGEPLDQRSDLFSFGILLCELVGIPHPFRRDSTTETIAAMLRDPPNLTGDLPQGLMLLIRRLLAKSREDRYQSMAEVRADLDRMEAGAPTPQPKEIEGRIPLRIPLIGREAEWKELLGHLQEALAGRGSIVMIGGEPGIGKTRLITAIMEEARRRGAYTNIGHCYETEGSPPYVPFVEMLERTARIAPKEGFRLTLGDAAPEVAKLMPELRRMYPDIPPAIQLPPEQQRRYFFNAYREFVERGAKVTPIVHVFEDLHWADESTLQLLLHVAQIAATLPMLLIGTYRDVELDVARPFASTLETLSRRKLMARIALRRLPVAGVEAMLSAMSGQVPPPPLVRAIFAETEGNPFFVEEVFRHLAEEGKLFDESGGWIPDMRVDRLEVPESVRLVIGKRLKRLSEESRRVLITAAVIGQGFSLGLLEALESARPDAALDAVEEAERAHLVMAEGGARDPRYRFVHELIRQTLAEGLSLPRRQRLHVRIAEAMERGWAASPDQHAQAIAHHLHQAGTAADSEKARHYLLRAADIAQQSAAHEDALANLDNAVLLLEGASGLVRADIEERRAGVLRSLGLREAAVAYEAAIAGFAAAGEPVRAAAACLPLSWILGWSGDGAGALEIAQRALDLLGDRDRQLCARILSLTAPAMSVQGRVADALRTIAEANALGVSDVDMESAHSHAYFHAGQLQHSIEANERAFRIAQASGNPWFTVDAKAFGLFLRSALGPVIDAEAKQCLKQAMAKGNQLAIWSCRISIDFGALVRGEFQSASQSMQESIALAESLQNAYRFWDYCGLAALRDVLDEDAAMEGDFRRALGCELKGSASDGFSAAFLFRALAARGDVSALDALRHPGISMPVPGQPNRFAAYAAAVCAAEGLASLGHIEESAALLPAVEEFLHYGAEYAWLRSTRTAAGIASACAREWSRSDEHHRAAIHHADTAPARIFQPVSREWYAAMLSARGDVDRARPMLAEALALYEAIGMPGYARRASERLAMKTRQTW